MPTFECRRSSAFYDQKEEERKEQHRIFSHFKLMLLPEFLSFPPFP